jgi:hypothetical protein
MAYALATVPRSMSVFALTFWIVYGVGFTIGGVTLVWGLVPDDPGSDPAGEVGTLAAFLVVGWLPAAGVAYVVDAVL